jgi:hypothetical protein
MGHQEFLAVEMALTSPGTIGKDEIEPVIGSNMCYKQLFSKGR